MKTERRTVYIVRGKTYLDKRAAYRREALIQLCEECAKECTIDEDADGYPLHPPCAAACGYCGDRPSEQAINHRAGQLFEVDNGILLRGEQGEM